MYTSVLMLLGSCVVGQNPADEPLPPLTWAGDPSGGMPYLFKDSTGHFVGFEMDIAKGLERELGRKLIFKECDFDELLSAVGRKDFDFVMNGLETIPENLQQARFTRPYYVYQLQLIVRKGEKRFRTLAEAYDSDDDIHIGTLEDSAAYRLLKKKDLFIKNYKDQDDAFADLSHGRTIQAILMDLPIALYYAVPDLPPKDTKPSELFLKYARRTPGLEFAGSPFAEGFYGIAVHKDNEVLALQLDRALENMLKSGELKQILQKWDLWNVEQYKLFKTEVGTVQVSTSRPEVDEMAFTKYFPLLFLAALTTVDITVRSMALAIVLALPICLCRLYGPAPVRWLAVAYVEFFRGIPVLLLLYFLYFGLADISDTLAMKPMVAAVLGFGLNYAAYEAEVYRAAISNVPVGQWEAASSLGMSPFLTFRRIIFPQSIRGILPPMTNDLVALFKDTSLVSVITLTELNKEYQNLSKGTGGYLPIVLTTAALYLLMSVPLGHLSRYLEKRWGTK